VAIAAERAFILQQGDQSLQESWAGAGIFRKRHSNLLMESVGML